jgi:twitching motility protein PilT
MAQIDAFFKMLHEHGGSDLHLSSGSQPMIRLHGELQRIKFKMLEHEELKSLLYEIVPERKIKEFEESGEVDFGYEVPNIARYRANFFMQRRGISAVFREIPEEILTLDELKLPPILKDLGLMQKGIVLVTGPTGSGKSTTLAAMLNHCNEQRKDHIITIEDPIEFVHQNKHCLINQRELGRDTLSFTAALRGALREDPDIILVGEMRDLESIELALTAAETGHLVMSTLHTSSAVKTIDRVIDVFPEESQQQIRNSLSESLAAVISQTLFKRQDAPGRVAALEILIATPAVRNLIRENKTHQIPSIMQTSKHHGMQFLDDELMLMLTAGKITAMDAYTSAQDKRKFAALVKDSEKPEYMKAG